MPTASRYETFIKRPLTDHLGFTPAHRKALGNIGIKTFEDVIELEIDKCLFPEPLKLTLQRRQEELQKMAEKERLEDIATQPMPPVKPQKESPARHSHQTKARSQSTALNPLPDSESMALGCIWNPRQQAGDNAPPETVLFPFESLKRHVFIAGGTGSGKTVLAKVMLEESAANGIPSIVIDPAGDLAQLWMHLPFDPEESERVRCAEEMSTIHDKSVDSETSLKRWATLLETHFRLQVDGGVDKTTADRAKNSICVRLFAPVTEEKGTKLALPAFDPQVLTRLNDDSDDEYHDRIALSLEELVDVLGLTGDKGKRVATVLTNLIERHPDRFCTNDPLGELRSAFDRLPSLLPEIQGMSVTDYIEERLCKEFQRNVVTYQAGTGKSWLSGASFDLALLMESDPEHTPINVISLHHLSPTDQQRAVARIISRVDHWMRNSQSDSRNVRGVLYLDELGGGGGKQAFFPPVARPVSKPPLMRLVRQARKYGIGVVFATQNMKDIDYQGLANINSWFVGKINNARETDYIADGIAKAEMTRGQITGHEISRHLPSLSPGQFLHVDNQGQPQLMRSRYLSSFHCPPDSVPGVYDEWKRKHEEECNECASEFLSNPNLHTPSIRVKSSPFFVEFLFNQLTDSIDSHTNALACLAWIIVNSTQYRQHAEDIVCQQTGKLPSEEALAWISTIVGLNQTSTKAKSDLESRRLAILMEQGDTAAQITPSGNLTEPRRSWWQQLLGAATSWYLTNEELSQAKFLGDGTAVQLAARDIKQIEFGSRSDSNIVQDVTDSITKECQSISSHSNALEWYRDSVQVLSVIEDENTEPEQETILDAMYANPLKAAEHFQLADSVKSQLQEMDAIEFEYYTADILRWRGIQANVTRASGDDGVDVFAIGPDGKRCAVQCKRYKKSVGPETLRELAGSKELHKCESALLVTTTSLTAAAQQTAGQLNIDVIDGNHLAALHLERG